MGANIDPDWQHTGNPPFVFATAHLESLNQARQRAKQLEFSLMQSPLASSSNSIFCGDTNINEGIDGQIRLPDSWEDAWKVKKTDCEGFTFDVARNPMVKALDGWARSNKARLRFDRFFSKLSNYDMIELELLGTEPIGKWKGTKQDVSSFDILPS